MLQKRVIYVSGLPRAGSTLLCQLLGMHPDVYSIGHSSPLFTMLNGIRYYLSDEKFFLAQLDSDFHKVYQRVLNANRGFIDGWFAETDKKWVVDKNRGWLRLLDLMATLDPQCKMLVCVRDLGQIYGSIEAQHQKTVALDFSEHLASLSRSDRCKNLFADDGLIGMPLSDIAGVADLPPALQQRLFFVVFEKLMTEPESYLQEIFTWLGLPDFALDVNHLSVQAHESDSYYRFKFLHKTHSHIAMPAPHIIPSRFEYLLKEQFAWFYQQFYA